MAPEQRAVPKFEHVKVVRQVAICAPSVRILRLSRVQFDDGSTKNYIDPIVALQSEVTDYYRRPSQEGAYYLKCSVHRELIEDGFVQVDRDVDTKMMYLGTEHFLIPFGDSDFMCDNEVESIVTAWWPPEEDGQRLEEHFEELQEKLGFKIEFNKKVLAKEQK